MAIDFLIIGQGLAGSLLAWELIRRGCRIVIIDNGDNNASRVAAGLVNPVTGRRFVKSEDVDTLLPVAKQFYAQLAERFRQPFYIEKPMMRLLRSEQELDGCLKRRDHPDYRQYLGDLYPAGECFGSLEATWGCQEQKQTGYLQTKALLSELKNFFLAKACYRQASLDYREIQFQPVLRWRDLRPERIIFCEGFQARHNPWFSCLPMRPVKGEILTLARPIGFPERIINNGHWLLPVDEHQLRIGATFDRENINTLITETGKAELLAASTKVYPGILHAKLINHEAGIRPCTSDRQPFVGRHPEYERLNVFNGFGAKGSLLIPGHSRQFADFLLNGSPLPESSTIQRYYATHFTA